jgi:signal transduction histidine kinase
VTTVADPPRVAAPIATEATADPLLLQMERAQFAQFEFQRRYNLLRILVPVIFVLAILALPGALYTDISGQRGVLGIFSVNSSTFQVIVILVGMTISVVALRRRQVALAAYALFFGVSGLIFLLLLNDTLLSGALALGTVPEFALLLVPIVLASVLGGPVLIVLTTIATTSLTFALLTFTQHDASFILFQHNNAGGLVLYTVPIALQIVTGALIYGSLAGLRRAQLQLSSVRAAYERERELDRLKNQFIASINHELRTPLMALQGYLMLAREFGKAGELDEQDQMFDLGLESMQHINALVESILDVRRIETDVTSVKLAPVDLHAAIVKATALVDPRSAGQGERDIHLRVPTQLFVLADDERLRQVLINLISNAIKYSPAIAPIKISAQLVPFADEQRRSDAAPMAQISVRDYGLGVPPEQIPLLFQRFVRLQRDIASTVTGTGLGLAICRAYVEAMGGRIWVESSGVEGEGSTFAFTLPLAD